MIAGIGTDIISINRIATILDRYGDHFVKKILGPQELKKYTVCKTKSHRIRFLATRFAAKEAFSKAIGTGMKLSMTWHSAQFLNIPNGQPIVVTTGDINQLMEKQGLVARVTLTDETEYAVAFVIIEQVNGEKNDI